MDIILSFATEVAHSKRAHDLIRTFAEFLSAEGLTGNFHLTGDYARALRRNSRQDVVAALQKHEIGFHCNHHGSRPFMGGYLENNPWRSGVNMWLNNELPAIRKIEALLGITPKYYTTEFSKAPQAVYGAFLAGLKTNGFIAGMPSRGKGAVWYCNAFVPAVDNLLGLDYLFRTNFDTEAKALEQFTRQQELLKNSKTGLLRIFTHEYRYLHTAYETPIVPADYYKHDNLHYEDFAAGGYFPHMPEEDTAVVVEKFKHVIQYISGQPDCRFMSFSQYMDQFQPNNDIWLDLDELRELAEFYTERLDAYETSVWTVSPAEAFGLLVRAVRQRLECGKVPENIYLRNLLGPLDELHEDYENNYIPLAPLPELLIEIDRELDDSGAIPGLIEINGNKFGPGQLLNALAIIYLLFDANQELPQTVKAENRNLPEIGSADFFQEKEFLHGKLYPDDFTGERICEFCRRQSWSWKPALRK
jgi:hypothetical protein